MAPLGGADPLYGTRDPDALRGVSHQLKQHITTPREIVEGLRTVAARMEKTRPRDAARLLALAEAYELCEVRPSLDLAAGLDALAEALRYPERVLA